MGKTSFQAAKAARYASAADGDADEAATRNFGDGTTDVTFHTSAWHQARIEQLMRPRITYDEWLAKAKEAEGKLASVAEEEEARMQEYRAQLDADRAARMGKPGAAAKDKDKSKDKKKRKKSKKSKKDSKDKKSKKSKDKKDRKKSSKDKKRKRSRDSDSSSSSSGSDSDSDSGSSSNSDDDRPAVPAKRKRGEDEPVKLSEFLRG